MARTPRGMITGIAGREGIKQIITWHRRGMVIIKRLERAEAGAKPHFAGVKWS